MAILNLMCILNFMLFDISILTQKGWKCVSESSSLNLTNVLAF